MQITIEVKNIDKIGDNISVLNKVVKKSLLSSEEEILIVDTISILKGIAQKVGYIYESE